MTVQAEEKAEMSSSLCPPRVKGLSFALLVWTCLLLVVPPASADVLVTRDGQRIETDGPWEVKGRQVVFTNTAGVLSVVRLSEIDLEASELATNPPEPEVAADTWRDDEPRLGDVSQKGKDRPQAVMTLTNDDVGMAKVEEIEDFASAFGGALLEMQRAIAHSLAEMSDDPDATRQEIDRQLEAQEDELAEFGKAFEEMLETLTAVVERYPELQTLNPEDPDSIRENAAAIRSAAADIRTAAQQAESEQAREMLNGAADQMEATAAGY